MRYRISNIILGGLFLLLGLALLGNAMDWWSFHLFFDGWWTIFIIVPCAVSMIQSGVHVGNTVGLAIGVLLLLRAQDVLSVDIYKLILPGVLVVVGLSILFRRPWQPHQYTPGEAPPPPPQNERRRGGPNPDLFACFSGTQACFTGSEFHGGSLTAVFGGAELDLRGAIITQDVTVTATAVFGGADILVDDRVQVRCSSTPILGGVECSIGQRDAALPTVFVNSVAVFGGVDIK